MVTKEIRYYKFLCLYSDEYIPFEAVISHELSVPEQQLTKLGIHINHVARHVTGSLSGLSVCLVANNEIRDILYLEEFYMYGTKRVLASSCQLACL